MADVVKWWNGLTDDTRKWAKIGLGAFLVVSVVSHLMRPTAADVDDSTEAGVRCAVAFMAHKAKYGMTNPEDFPCP